MLTKSCGLTPVDSSILSLMEKPRKILLVDDELELLELCSLALSKCGFLVDKTYNGLKAKEFLLQNDYDALITDLRLPQMNGMELLRWSQEHIPSMKLIVITGFAPVIGSMGAKDLGCEALLIKPFEMHTLIAALERALTPTPTQELTDNDYARVPADEFNTEHVFPHPLFLRLSDGRFLKIVHHSSDLDGERLQNLKNKGIQDLWVLKKDFDEYLKISQQAVLQALASDNGDDNRRRLLKHGCEVAAEYLRVAGVNESSLDYARQSLDMVLEDIKNQPKGRELLDLFFSSPSTRPSHAILCGLLSSLIGKIMGFNEEDCAALALGGFVHDIGLHQLPKTLYSENTSGMSATEIKQFQQHPVLGLEEMQRLGNVKPQVLLIILQHHEEMAGNGYPGGLLKKDISPLVFIVRAVDEFCMRILDLEPTQRKLSSTILEIMVSEQRGRYAENVICALHASLASSSLSDACAKYEAILQKTRGLI